MSEFVFDLKGISGSVASFESGLSANTPNDKLTYSGTDPIVWDRVNNERLRRGLSPLPGTRPVDDGKTYDPYRRSNPPANTAPNRPLTEAEKAQAAAIAKQFGLPDPTATAETFKLNCPPGTTREQAFEIFKKQADAGGLTGFAPGDILSAETQAKDGLEAAKAEAQEYYFTRASSYLGQPAPLRWIIKGWLPDSSVNMVYGESGAGKTFLTLDMACHIASGKDWHGHKTKPGIVVYMAGEGNYGLRQRVTAWCKQHSIETLDNLLISNKAVDIDSPAVAAQIINAIREITQDDVAAIFIDTVNNHMSGDENSAKDTRNMLNACQIVSRALNSSICLNHHTGHSVDSKNRARGSSAWKASLDSSILVMKVDNSIEVSCTKMKDAEPPNPFFGKLSSVDLGWVDEDNQPITGAVFTLEDNPPTKKDKKEPAINKHIKLLENAWWHSGAEIRLGVPYVSRSGFLNYLVGKMGISEASSKVYVRESATGRPISDLLLADVITSSEHGWVVTNDVLASSLLVRKSGS
jgi:hypothetical protein